MRILLTPDEFEKPKVPNGVASQKLPTGSLSPKLPLKATHTATALPNGTARGAEKLLPSPKLPAVLKAVQGLCNASNAKGAKEEPRWQKSLGGEQPSTSSKLLLEPSPGQKPRGREANTSPCPAAKLPAWSTVQRGRWPKRPRRPRREPAAPTPLRKEAVAWGSLQAPAPSRLPAKAPNWHS